MPPGAPTEAPPESDQSSVVIDLRDPRHVLPKVKTPVLHWSLIDGDHVAAVIVLLAVAFIAGVVLRGSSPMSECPEGVCAQSERVAVGGTEQEGRMQVKFLPCGGETVRRVAVIEVSTSEVVWEQQASAASRRTTFVTGVPQGDFEETIPLVELPRLWELTALVEADFTHTLSFSTLDLEENLLFQGAGFLTPTEFQEQAGSATTCAEWQPSLGLADRVLLPWLILLALGAAAFLASGRVLGNGLR